jgi:DNA-damage-inducible protein J
MSKTTLVSAPMDSALKRNAEQILKKLGLTPVQAITLFYKQIELEHGLPFSIRIPNEATRLALEQARKRQNLEAFNTLDDLFKDLEQ